MAIIIKSSSIFEKNNPKIIRNIINKISVNFTKISPQNEYETPIFNTNVPPKNETSTYDKKTDTASLASTPITFDKYAAYAELTLVFCDVSISFKRLSNNSYIDKVLLGTNKNGSANIKCSVIGDIITENAIAVVTFEDNVTDDSAIGRPRFWEKDKKVDTRYYPESDISLEAKATIDHISATATPNDLSNITDDNIMTDSEDEIVLNFRVLIGDDNITLQGKYTYNPIDSDSFYTIEGTRVRHIAKEIEITVYGNTLGINLEEMYKNFGKGSNPYSLEGNELIREDATIGNLSQTDFLANIVLDRYINGKETAKIRCSIGEYYEYDENEKNFQGKKVISTKEDSLPMFIPLHSQVIPMVFTPKGDKPMSVNVGGTPKVFEVIGSRIFYDGAVWQELTLQEYKEVEV